MQLQYISDNQGHTTAVQLQIPIEDWNALKKKYNEFAAEEKAATLDIPQWQIELGKKELQNIANGSAGLQSWEDAKKQLKP